MISLSTQVLDHLNATQKKPRVLVEIALTGQTLRYVGAVKNLTFPSTTTWTAKAMEISGVGQDMDGQANRLKLRLDNVTRDMAAQVNSYDFEGRTITIKQIFLSTSGATPSSSGRYREVFAGRIDRMEGLDYEWLELSAVAGKTGKTNATDEAYERLCRWRFGSTECNTNSLADLTTLKTSGYANGGTVDQILDTSTRVADFWNYGRITVNATDGAHERIVNDFQKSGTTGVFVLDLALPTAPTTKTGYIVYKGCPKTWPACGATGPYGPSANNSANFGGFIHITEE